MYAIPLLPPRNIRNLDEEEVPKVHGTLPTIVQPPLSLMSTAFHTVLFLDQSHKQHLHANVNLDSPNEDASVTTTTNH